MEISALTRLKKNIFRYSLASIGLLAFTLPVQAQVIPDSSLGTINTNGNITGGVTTSNSVTQNLFHSFQDFSLSSTDTVTFIAPSTVENIIARVTGRSPSFIDGTLQINNNTSNLFLINPAGITFGANAQLRLPSSFVASTAERAAFQNGFVFDVGSLNSPPLMTVSAPIGLQMGSGAIAVNNNGHNLMPINPSTGRRGRGFLPHLQQGASTGLQVLPGKTLGLFGNGIQFQGGVVTANSGHVDIGSVSENSSVHLTPTPLGFVASYPQANGQADFQDISFAGRSLVNVSGVPTPLPMPGTSLQIFTTPQGTLQVTGDDITLTDASALLGQAGIAATQAGGDIRVAAAGTLTLSGSEATTHLRSGIFSETIGNSPSGDIHIKANQLTILGGAAISGSTFTGANSGGIDVDVDQLLIEGFNAFNPTLSSAIATIAASSTGTSGNIEITEAERITLLAGGSISSLNFAQGQAGNLLVEADDITLSGRIQLSDIPSSISASNFGPGAAGNVEVISDRLTIEDQAVIAASSITDGPAGSLKITAHERIDLRAALTDQRNSFSINSAVLGPTGTERAIFNIPANFVPSGDAGNIDIKTSVLNLEGPVNINVQNDGLGNGGQARIVADSVLLRDGSKIGALTANGEGGDVDFQISELLILRSGSQLNVESGGVGDGGNISISSPVIIALENSDIIANAVQGRGGNISITSRSVLGTEFRDRLTSESDITASSEFGVSGTVELDTPQADPSSDVIALSTTTLNPDQQIARSCTDSLGNHFIASGRGGIPISPREAIAGTSLWRDIRRLPMHTHQESARQLSSVQQEVVHTEAPPKEATHWSRTTNGDIQLIDGGSILSHTVACLKAEEAVS
ncbi:MAG: filamentous hemagglutinin N-terminal domain-containing protein [Phormidesmis sp.]